jgi:hypothetical protein
VLNLEIPHVSCWFSRKYDGHKKAQPKELSFNGLGGNPNPSSSVDDYLIDLGNLINAYF